MANSFKDLLIWQKGMAIAEMIYDLTKGYPSVENFGLTSQTQRSAVSVPSNIAEGWGRKGDKSHLQFLRIAHGSLCELETQMILAQRLGYITEEKSAVITELIIEESKMLNSMMNKIKKEISPQY